MKKLMLILLIGMFIISFSNAFEFDNTLRYEKDDMKVTIENAFGLPFFGSDLGSVELKSHSNVNEIKKLHYGREDVVMWYNLEGWELYENGLGEVTFTNLTSGELIQKDYYFVEWAFAPAIRYIYDNVVIGENPNGSNIYENKIIGTYEENEWQWVNYTSKDIPDRDVRIGLKTYIEKGDRIDAVWTLAGKKISKHAGWEADWNTGLQNYFKFEETTGAVAIDSLNNNNGTIQGTLELEAPGQILNSFKSVAANDNWVEVPTTAISQNTINIWMIANGSIDSWAG